MHLVKVTSLVLISYCLIGLIHAAPPQATEGDGVKVNNNNEVKDFVPSPEVDPSSSTKFIPFSLPAFLANAKPQPMVFGNASTQGEVGGLYAANNNTLISMSGPNSTAIASLNSTSFYFAKPINETVNSTSPDGQTLGQSLAGFTVTAQEDTHAYAEGDFIQFINHGGSYATGLGESSANGTTENGSGWATPGWKGWEDVSNKQNDPNPMVLSEITDPIQVNAEVEGKRRVDRN